MTIVEWHWLIYVPIMATGIGYLLFKEAPRGNYISLDIIGLLVFVGLIVFSLIWGGIFWW